MSESGDLCIDGALLFLFLKGHWYTMSVDLDGGGGGGDGGVTRSECGTDGGMEGRSGGVMEKSEGGKLMQEQGVKNGMNDKLACENPDGGKVRSPGELLNPENNDDAMSDGSDDSGVASGMVLDSVLGTLNEMDLERKVEVIRSVVTADKKLRKKVKTSLFADEEKRLQAWLVKLEARDRELEGKFKKLASLHRKEDSNELEEQRNTIREEWTNRKDDLTQREGKLREAEAHSLRASQMVLKDFQANQDREKELEETSKGLGKEIGQLKRHMTVVKEEDRCLQEKKHRFDEEMSRRELAIKELEVDWGQQMEVLSRKEQTVRENCSGSSDEVCSVENLVSREKAVVEKEKRNEESYEEMRAKKRKYEKKQSEFEERCRRYDRLCEEANARLVTVSQLEVKSVEVLSRLAETLDGLAESKMQPIQSLADEEGKSPARSDVVVRNVGRCDDHNNNENFQRRNRQLEDNSCRYCKLEGHWKRECPKLRAKEERRVAWRVEKRRWEVRNGLSVKGSCQGREDGLESEVRGRFLREEESGNTLESRNTLEARSVVNKNLGQQNLPKVGANGVEMEGVLEECFGGLSQRRQEEKVSESEWNEMVMRLEQVDGSSLNPNTESWAVVKGNKAESMGESSPMRMPVGETMRVATTNSMRVVCC